MEVQLKRWKLNKCATLPTCNSLLQVPFLFWLLEGAGAKISKVLVLVFMFDALVAIFRSSLLWFLDPLCSFIVARMRVGLNTELRTCGCIAQFWWQLVLGRFAHTTQTCKGLFFFKRTFFCWGPSGRRTEISVQFGPVRTKRTFSKKTNLFFHVRPSIHQNCFSSWHHKIRASGCAQTLCIFRISVAMCKCLPPQLIIKSRRRFYILTRVVDPKLFSHEVLVMRLGPNDVWGCLIQHQTGQAQSALMI